MSSLLELLRRCAPQIRKLFEYWEILRGKRNCPSRSDFEPSAIPELLEFISLVDVSSKTPRFVYRLMGTRVVHLLGKELTGEAVGTGVKRSELVSVIQRYESVADNMAPFYHRNFLQEEFDDYTEVERLMLPLSNDGKTVNIILIPICID